MKSFKIIFTFLLMTFLLAGSAAQAQDAKEGWSRKPEGAAIGDAAGAVTGLYSAAAKAPYLAPLLMVGGCLIGHNQDKKKDPVRYNGHRNKKINGPGHFSCHSLSGL